MLYENFIYNIKYIYKIFLHNYLPPPISFIPHDSFLLLLCFSPNRLLLFHDRHILLFFSLVFLFPFSSSLNFSLLFWWYAHTEKQILIQSLYTREEKWYLPFCILLIFPNVLMPSCIIFSRKCNNFIFSLRDEKCDLIFKPFT